VFMKKSLQVKALAILFCVSLLVSLLPTATMATTRPITMEFDGRLIASEVPPIIVGGRTLVPMRVVFETLGALVTWDENTRTVTGHKAGNVIVLTIGNPTATVNGSPVRLDQAPRITAGRTLVPLRFVAETLGALVEWDESKALVKITSTAASERRSPLDRTLRLTTGGASFPFPLYARLTAEYARITAPTIQIDYASVGSGAGIRGLLARTFDFAGTDAPLTDEQMAQVLPNQVLHIPTVMGAVAVIYNVEGVRTGLRLTADVLADIFLGRLTHWNDPRIVQLNAGVTLPNQRITVVRRSDASGTTFIFTDYLSAVSEPWRTGPSRGTAVAWPSPGNVGARGNEGVSAQVGQIPGAIGYVELSHAIINKLDTVVLRNRAGNFVAPSVAATTAAAAGLAREIPADMRASLVNSPGANAYPIVGLTWIIVYRDQTDLAKANAMVDFLRWAVVERNLEPFAEELHYAPLAQELIDRVREQLRTLTFHGLPIWR